MEISACPWLVSFWFFLANKHKNASILLHSDMEPIWHQTSGKMHKLVKERNNQWRKGSSVLIMIEVLQLWTQVRGQIFNRPVICGVRSWLTCIPEESTSVGSDHSGTGVIETISTVVTSLRNAVWWMQISNLRVSCINKTVSLIEWYSTKHLTPVWHTSWYSKACVCVCLGEREEKPLSNDKSVNKWIHTCRSESAAPLTVEAPVTAITVVPVPLLVLQTISKGKWTLLKKHNEEIILVIKSYITVCQPNQTPLKKNPKQRHNYLLSSGARPCKAPILSFTTSVCEVYILKTQQREEFYSK